MACCAFAAFLIGQMVLAFDALRRWLLGQQAPVTDGAVAWSLAGGPALTSSPTPAHRRVRPLIKVVAFASVIEVAVLGLAAFGLLPENSPPRLLIDAAWKICGAPAASNPTPITTRIPA